MFFIVNPNRHRPPFPRRSVLFSENYIDRAYILWYNYGIRERNDNAVKKTGAFTLKEILQYINKEERRLNKLKDEIARIRHDMTATRKAIKFWQNEFSAFVHRVPTNKKG